MFSARFAAQREAGVANLLLSRGGGDSGDCDGGGDAGNDENDLFDELMKRQQKQ